MSKSAAAARHCPGEAPCLAAHTRSVDMEYMLLVFSEPSKFDALPAEQQKEGLAAYGAYHEALEKAGVLRSAKRLRPAQAATIVRMKAGKSEVLNGPYAETREQLGGYFLIDVPHLDAA
ncbi:MAG: hypothetical protein E6H79_14595, partial [Betaproteobacteria bacterium]